MNYRINENFKFIMTQRVDPQPREPDAPPGCPVKRDCESCPYPSHGFVCWSSSDRSCMKDSLRRIYAKHKASTQNQEVKQ